MITLQAQGLEPSFRVSELKTDKKGYRVIMDVNSEGKWYVEFWTDCDDSAWERDAGAQTHWEHPRLVGTHQSQTESLGLASSNGTQAHDMYPQTGNFSLVCSWAFRAWTIGP